MKKLLTLLVAVALFSGGFAQQVPVLKDILPENLINGPQQADLKNTTTTWYLLDSAYNMALDTTQTMAFMSATVYKWSGKLWHTSLNYYRSNSGIINNYKRVREYDSLERVTKQTHYSYDYNNGNLFLSSKDTFSYNPDNSLNTKLVFIWNNNTSSWDTSSREMYFYTDINKHLDTMLYQYYSNGWINSYMRVFVYDSNDQLKLNDLYLSWDQNINNWVVYSQKIYTYNANNQLVSIVSQSLDYNTNQLLNYYKQLFYYDNQGVNIAETSYMWDTSLVDWVASDSIFHYVNNGILIADTSWSFNTNTQQWEYDMLNDYVYSNNLLTGLIIKVWSPNDNNWIDIYKYELVKNPSATLANTITPEENLNQMVGYVIDTLKVFQYDNNNSVWGLVSMDIYNYTTYTETVVTNIDNPQPGTLEIYPNPASDYVTLANSQPGDLVIIFDAQGKMVKSAKMFEKQLYLGNLPTGVYTLKLIGQNRVMTSKLIKQ